MITLNQARELVNKHDIFYEKEISVNGAKVFIFNYLISDFEAFQDLEGLGKELRGLTFVHDPHERVYLSIPKFYNLNENKETQYDDLRYKKIKKITDKADGSLIQPVCVNGDILMKTKQRFNDFRAKMAQGILDNDEELKFFILDCWDNDFFPLFELVSPENKIVVDYKETKLILIGVRNKEGEFIDIDKFNYKDKVKSYDPNITLEELIERAKTEKNKEGYVVKFTDGQIIKLKTIDYIEKHRLVSEMETYKITLKRILEETIDDVLPLLSNKRKEEIQPISERVAMYVAHWTKFCYDETRNVPDRRILAEKYKNHEYFSVIMASIKKSSVEDVKELVIKHVWNKNNREEKAKKFIKGLLV